MHIYTICIEFINFMPFHFYLKVTSVLTQHRKCVSVTNSSQCYARTSWTSGRRIAKTNASADPTDDAVRRVQLLVRLSLLKISFFSVF